MMGGIDGLQSAWAYPEGGMGSVSQAIAKSAASHGAHIFVNKVGVKKSLKSYLHFKNFNFSCRINESHIRGICLHKYIFMPLLYVHSNLLN